MSGFATAENAARVALLKRRAGSPPFFWAHRGASERAPEDSLSAWKLAMADGFGAESDWRKSSDGVFVSMHDATIDRTCTSVGTVSAMTAAALTAVDNGSNFNGTGYATERIPTLDQALDQLRSYNGWQLFENSNQVQADAVQMANQMIAKGVQDRCVLAQFGAPPYTVLTAIRAAYPTLKTQVLVLSAAAAPVPATLAAAGATYVTPDLADAYVDAAWVASCQAAGVKVMPYGADTLSMLAKAQSINFDGIITSRPKLYQRGVAYGVPFSEQWRGENDWMIGDDWLFDNASKIAAGVTYPRTYQGVCGTGNTTLLNGGMVNIGRPLPLAAESYQIDFTVILKAGNADTTRWCSFQFCLQQDSIINAFGPVTPGENGYGCVFRQNGNFSIDKYVSNTASASIATAASTALVVDQPTPFRLTVTPTQLTLRRLDTAVQCTVADNAFRAGKVGLIWSNLGTYFGPFVGTSL